MGRENRDFRVPLSGDNVERILTDSPYHSVQIRNQNCLYNAATTSDHVFEIPYIWKTLSHFLTFLCVACQVFLQRDKQRLWNAETVIRSVNGCFLFF